MDKNKRLVIAIITIVAFLYVVFSLNMLLANSSSEVCPVTGTDACPHKQQLDFLITALPLIASIAVVAGAGTYYLMVEKVESKGERLRETAEVLLKFLSPDERKLVNLLIENNGKALQAEATRLPGMSKVKSHRVVQRLVDRGVIEKEKLGKTNVMQFTKKIREGLLQ